MKTGQTRAAPAALITGGSRGIGRAIALRLSEAGYRTLFVHYLENDAEAEVTRREVEAHGARCLLRGGNLIMPQEIHDLAEWVRNEHGTLDTFVHAAALGVFKPLIDVKANQWDISLNVNARAFVLCAQALAPFMAGGTMIAISSLGSRTYVPNYGALGPSKAALEAAVRQLAVELAPRGIRVNAVSGGFVRTDSLSKFPDAARLVEVARARTPAGRLGEPDDIARVVAFLAGREAQWIYGQTIVADGGASLT